MENTLTNVKAKPKKSPVDVIFKVAIAAILIFYTLTIFYILFWAIITSFKTEADFDTNHLGFPALWEGATDLEIEKYHNALRFGNYAEIFKYLNYEKKVTYFTMLGFKVTRACNANFFGLLANTLYIAGFCSLAQVLSTYTMAYMAQKYKFKFSGVIYGIVIIMMSVPTVGTTPATLVLLQDLGVYGTHIGMLLMRFCYGGMYFLVFYGFFEGLPDSYMEAAEIDGASQFSIYLRIILPMGIKMIATVTLLLFVTNWNDYNMSFTYMPTVPTLAFSIYNLVHVLSANPHLRSTSISKMSACLILVLPIAAIFIIFKDKLMGNISAGGLKG
jgi:ABC-type glycerol-3-phosphate transport system permease component